MAYNDQTLILYNLSSNDVTTKTFDLIYDAEFLIDDTLALLIKNENTVEYVRILPTGETKSQRLEAKVSSKNARDKLVDISRNGDLIFSDSHQELVYWDPDRPSEYTLTGFYTLRPAGIYLYPDQVAAIADIDGGSSCTMCGTKCSWAGCTYPLLHHGLSQASKTICSQAMTMVG